MMRIFLTRVIAAAARVAVIVFTGRLLSENADNIMTENNNNLTAE